MRVMPPPAPPIPPAARMRSGAPLVSPAGRPRRALLPLVMVALAGCQAPPAAGEPLDLAAVARIKAEALDRSRVMDHAFYLTDVHGPRLTGSPGFDSAAAWAERRLGEYGLVNLRRESFPWGRGWASERFSAELTAPQHAPLLGLPLPWSPGTDGPVEDVPVHAPLPAYARWSEQSFRTHFDAYVARYRGRLRGKIVLIEPERPLEPPIQPLLHRFTAEELAEIAAPPAAGPPRLPSVGARQTDVPFEERADRLMRFYRDEGVRLLVLRDFSDGSGVLALSHTWGSNWPHLERYAPPTPALGLYAEHYDRIVRLLARGIPVRLRAEVGARVRPAAPAYSLTADLPGTDRREELVMVGAHLDSWTLGTGATDNAAGVAVMMEAARVLTALGLRPRRTIRVALWGGHEGEGAGARTYVREHFGTAERPTPARGRLSAYFNLDNGTGRIRGIYLEENAAAGPVFARWLEPFRALGATTVALRGMPGTDHRAFVAAGLPGYQFIQDPVDYARTHHTNLDLYGHLQEADLKQAAAIVATFAYLAATRDALLPRRAAQ
jgi:carboxypeptidase Q